MNITIDKAGRLVIPKSIREKHHIHPGTVLELEDKPQGIFLKTVENSPSLIKKQGILVHHGGDEITIDIADFINRQRDRRDSDMVAEDPLA